MFIINKTIKAFLLDSGNFLNGKYWSGKIQFRPMPFLVQFIIQCGIQNLQVHYVILRILPRYNAVARKYQILDLLSSNRDSGTLMRSLQLIQIHR